MEQNRITPTLLIIMDGFGEKSEYSANAIAQAHMPCFKHMRNNYPHTLLKASGLAVGLPAGMNGNSEVGHLTIGSGRIIKQPLTLLNNMIDNGTFFTQPLLNTLLTNFNPQHTLHIMGLLSDGNVHSNTKQFFAFIKAAIDHNISNIVVHPFLDGRDVPPKSASLYLQQLTQLLHNHGVMGSIHGRFYSMDRDHNWDRTEQSYHVLTTDSSPHYNSWQTVLEHYYAKGITDEYIPPTKLNSNATIKADDAVIFCNIRPDRARQLTACFVDPDLKEKFTHPIALSFFMTPVDYGDQLQTDYLLPNAIVQHTLKQVLSAHNKTILSIAETEKYAHVTYFFDGNQEAAVQGETRILIDSLKTDSYISSACMSAPTITQRVLDSLHTQPADFYLINYANADMVGHSGNINATIQALECLDKQLAQLYCVAQKMNATLYITSDHGKAEDMLDPSTNQPRTAHTNNPVPFVVVCPPNTCIEPIDNVTELSDIAPYILKNMHLPIPVEMQSDHAGT